MRRWFLIKKEFDGYDITVRMYGYCKEDLKNEITDELELVDEETFFKRLTELAS